MLRWRKKKLFANTKEWTGHFMQDLLTSTQNRLCQQLRLSSLFHPTTSTNEHHNHLSAGTSQEIYDFMLYKSFDE